MTDTSQECSCRDCASRYLAGAGPSPGPPLGLARRASSRAEALDLRRHGGRRRTRPVASGGAHRRIHGSAGSFCVTRPTSSATPSSSARAGRPSWPGCAPSPRSRSRRTGSPLASAGSMICGSTGARRLAPRFPPPLREGRRQSLRALPGRHPGRGDARGLPAHPPRRGLPHGLHAITARANRADGYRRHLWVARASRVWKGYLRLATAIAGVLGTFLLLAQYFLLCRSSRSSRSAPLAASAPAGASRCGARDRPRSGASTEP